MRITCPICGERDSREFSYRGAALALERPAPDAGEDAWAEYVHLRENPAGVLQELWYHESGCSAWIVVQRNTTTHEVIGAELAAEVAR